MEEAIVRKLRALLSGGVHTEPQLVYLLVEIRKLYESRNAALPPYLEMFCDWAVHAKLDRAKWGDLAKELKDRRIASAEFRRSLACVLTSEGLPEPTAWPQVSQLLAAVLKDCPLEFAEVVQKIKLTVAPGRGEGWAVTFRLIEPGPERPRHRRCPPPHRVR